MAHCGLHQTNEGILHCFGVRNTVVRVVDSSREIALVVCLNSASAARVIAASASVTASAGREDLDMIGVIRLEFI